MHNFAVPLDETWRLEANCRGADVHQFYLSCDDFRDEVAQIRKLCEDCSVVVECLDYAQQTKEKYGIWGSRTESNRQRNRTQANATRPEMRADIGDAVLSIAVEISEAIESADIEEEDGDYVMFLYPALRALAIA